MGSGALFTQTIQLGVWLRAGASSRHHRAPLREFVHGTHHVGVFTEPGPGMGFAFSQYSSKNGFCHVIPDGSHWLHVAKF